MSGLWVILKESGFTHATPANPYTNDASTSVSCRSEHRTCRHAHAHAAEQTSYMQIMPVHHFIAMNRKSETEDSGNKQTKSCMRLCTDILKIHKVRNPKKKCSELQTLSISLCRESESDYLIHSKDMIIMHKEKSFACTESDVMWICAKLWPRSSINDKICTHGNWWPCECTEYNDHACTQM